MSTEYFRPMELNKEILKEVFYGEKPLDIFSEDDKEWLEKMADAGNVHAICCLLDGMHDVIFAKDDGETERLTQMLYDAKERMSNEELWYAGNLPIDTTPLGVELIWRGEAKGASLIEDPEILMDLCQKGNKDAAYNLYRKYYYGDEAHGIPIDEQKAKEFYDLAGEVAAKRDMWTEEKLMEKVTAIKDETNSFLDKTSIPKLILLILAVCLLGVGKIYWKTQRTNKRKEHRSSLIEKKRAASRTTKVDYNFEVEYDTACVYDRNFFERLKKSFHDPGAPLVIIDGQQATEEQLETFNLNSIISVSWLRGDSAEESYGAEAKDGVIVIKTYNGDN